MKIPNSSSQMTKEWKKKKKTEMDKGYKERKRKVKGKHKKGYGMVWVKYVCMYELNDEWWMWTWFEF